MVISSVHGFYRDVKMTTVPLFFEIFHKITLLLFVVLSSVKGRTVGADAVSHFLIRACLAALFVLMLV